MPAKNPRVNLTVPSETYGLITELSDLRGISRSALVMELIEFSKPMLERVVIAMRALNSQKQRIDAMTEEERAEMVRSLEDAEKALSPLLADALGAFDRISGDLAQPPHSNTGVTPPSSDSPEKVKKTTEASNHGPSSRFEGSTHDGGTES